MSCEFDLSIMKILINVHVPSQPWKRGSPGFTWFMPGVGRSVWTLVWATLPTDRS